MAQNPFPNADTHLVVTATSPLEISAWGKASLDTRDATDSQRLRTYLQRDKKRSQYVGSFLNFDSDRAIRNISALPFSWDISNPLQEDVGWSMGFNRLTDRYN